jgi:hypothetical protein
VVLTPGATGTTYGLVVVLGPLAGRAEDKVAVGLIEDDAAVAAKMMRPAVAVPATESLSRLPVFKWDSSTRDRRLGTDDTRQYDAKVTIPSTQREHQ